VNDWTELIELCRDELEELALLRLGLRVTNLEEGVEDVKERVTELLALATLLLVRLGRLLDDRSDEVVNRERLATDNFELEDIKEGGIEDEEELD